MTRLILLGLLMLFARSATAQTEVAAGLKPDLSVALVSDYRYRGISQSDRDPALQLTADLSHPSGIYAGTFVSTIGRYVVDGANPEIDVYGGVRRTIGGAAVDGGLLYYVYPGTNGFKGDYFEPYASIGKTVGPVSAKVGGNFAWKQRGLRAEPGERRAGIYTYVEATAAVPKTPVTLGAHVGHAFHATYATFDKRYTDWALTASYTRKRVSLAVSYIDTDTRVDSYPDGGRNHNVAGAGIICSVTLAVF